MMRARRVTFKLAIIALSALTLYVISLTDCARAASARPADTFQLAVPDTLGLFQETISVGSDGDARIDIIVVLEQGGTWNLLMPFDHGAADDVAILSGPAVFAPVADGLAPPVVEVLGYTMLNLRTTPAAAAGDTIKVRAVAPGWFDADAASRPFGEYGLGRRFTNTSSYVMREVRLSLRLPEGLLVHAVDRIEPAWNPKGSPEPPFQITRLGDHGEAVLHLAEVPPMARGGLDLRARPARRGPIPLAIGLVLGGLYLVFFRSVLKPREVA